MIKQEYIHIAKVIFWIGFFFLIAALVFSAVEKKKGATVVDMSIDIEQLEVGYSLINTEDVLLLIENSFGYKLTGIPIGSIDVERVERVLKSDPFVKNANVYIDARNIIHIELSQREPILRVIDKNGLSYYLDRKGGNVPLSKHYTPRVIVATGNINPYDRDYLKKKKHVLKDLYALTQRILEDEFLAPMVEQIYVAKTGDYHLIPKVGDQKIILGDMDRLEEKILYLKNFYKEAMPFKGWQKYKTINLTFKGQVVAGKK
ncbi:MAG: cell division protein FtsQ [Saprospiraceae bacterium]|jgi:cell division protein FtsQ